MSIASQGRTEPIRITFDPDLPLWYQVARSLRWEIENRYSPGDRLPPEVELASMLGVSVVTVRQAMGALEREGLVSRHRAKGTFVTEEATRRRRIPFSGSLDDLIGHEYPPGMQTQLLESRVLEMDERLAASLGLEAGELYYFYRRLWVWEGEPLAYLQNYLPEWVGEKVDVAELNASPMLQILKRIMGQRLQCIRKYFEAVQADPEVAAFLGVRLGDPVLSLRSEIYDLDNSMVNLALIQYRADRYRLSLELRLDVKGGHHSG